ncbi:hypothetical protein H4R26_000011 [Coemansia thaxteri]|uniref:CobW/HypB/UreG nucleotide-binding domain-containing protein n=1 Tax=Coemansia thaxteri TaxID=2663907 RepID=A0A9W8BPD2_9FUNG|nr:hypothetical protein H4R26_000011 [Coemansia thaxteri]
MPANNNTSAPEVCSFKGTTSHDHSHSHSHDHDHSSPHSHSHPASHGHSHDVLDHPGRYHERTPYNRVGRDWGERAFTVGIGGPVGSGKTALMLQLCRALRSKYNLACVTNDIFTREDAEFLTRNAALDDPDRIMAVETGGCPHAAVREDITANLHALETLHAKFNPELLLIESGGDNLAANFSRELADYIIYVIDVSGGDKIPRKGGPGITMSDLLVINKTDLASAVGADLDVMLRDASQIRDNGPVTMAVIKHGKNVDEIASGKEEVANYLVHQLAFTRLYLSKDQPDPSVSIQNGGVHSCTDSNEPRVFATVKLLLNYITPRWRQNYVSTDITSPVDLYLMWKRPFAMVVGIDAPTSIRYKRYCAKAHASLLHPPLTLAQFIDIDDALLYACQEPPPPRLLSVDADPATLLSPVIRNAATAHELNLKRVLSSANVSIANTFTTLANLHAHLDKIDLLNPERIRPSWDTYFMLLSELASHRANCMKRWSWESSQRY